MISLSELYSSLDASHADESAEWTMCLNGTCRQAACPG